MTLEIGNPMIAMVPQDVPPVVALACVFALLLSMEWAFPLRRRSRTLLGRLSANVITSVLAFSAGALIVRPAAFGLIDWSASRRFGLLPWLPVPQAVRAGLGFLLMDLTFYYWHRVNHVVRPLWRFHRVHHLDPDMDVTTSFRFHIGEVLYSVGFRAAQVWLLGVSARTYIVYEVVFQCVTMFHHSNLRMPIGLERVLNRIIVTPRMHGIHPSIVRREMNSNFSVVFRVWDAIHRSLIVNVPQAQITIGVAGHLAEADNKLTNLLLLPFRRSPGNRAGSETGRRPEDRPDRRTVMAE